MRYRAKAGQGEELAGLLLHVAERLRATAACELYLISRDAADADVVWVQEIWSGEADAEAALAQASDADEGPKPQDVLALVDGRPERFDTVPLGGVADPTRAPDGHTIRNLADSEDLAAKHGMGELTEVRFPTGDLGAGHTGLSHHRIKPRRRQPFGHRHARAEEVYVVLAGSGQVKIEDEVSDLRPLDAVRVGPGQTRAFAAGDDGLELLAFGPRHRGDSEMLPGWWTD